MAFSTTFIFVVLLTVCHDSLSFSENKVRPESKQLRHPWLHHPRESNLAPAQTGKAKMIGSHLTMPIVAAAVSICLTMPISVAYAGDVSNGSKIFEANCVACHVGGKNLVNPERNLSKEAIYKNLGQVEESTVKKFIQDGLVHRGVFAFGGKLKDTEFSDVSAFVVDQASQGW
eukprot:CAMPEP_0116005170 /NCGR_PEP_ID=MMETSP0321-20121206/1018_1 /TAXON_ID=163516 /ORGANISM="Leptocylindrus danicus var. danicus, Strain B650" /LENGTH=172 /DNA_ID=CAMNT_0003473571 /DNA_START=56 /DNA_END=571 /DNA_ORIENTATION=-